MVGNSEASSRRLPTKGFLFAGFLLFSATLCDFRTSSAIATPTTTTTTLAGMAAIPATANEKAEEDAAENATVASVTAKCTQRCRDEDGVFLDEFGIKCPPGDVDEKCFYARCARGCQHWWRALQEFEPCQDACSSLQFFPFDLPCVTACEVAQRLYWHLRRSALQDAVDSVRPQLLHDNRSLTLHWPIEFQDKYWASRPFNVQYGIVRGGSVELPGAGEAEGDVDDTAAEPKLSWTNLADYNCDEDFNCDIIDGLMPYTSYRFRFELPFGESSVDVLHSPPTRVFKTPAEGAPISSPVIENVLVPDESHVELYWKPGEFLNGPLTGYKLRLEKVDGNYTLERLIPPEQRQYIVTDLKPRTNYALKLCMMNAEGCGPETQVNVTTKDLASSPTEDADLSRLLLVGEYSIQLKDLETLTSADTRLVYRSDEPISDYCLHLETQRLFVVDTAGHIFSAHLEDPNEREALYLNRTSDNFKPIKLTIDWLSPKLYIAGEIGDKTWSIARADVDGANLEFLLKDLPQPIKQLEADPVNGWLFWLQGDGLERLNLDTRRHEMVANNANLTSFSIDFSRNLLIAYDSSDRQLLELSFEGSFRQQLLLTVNSNTNYNNRSGNSSTSGVWQSFAISTGHLHVYATNGTHLIHLNAAANEYDVGFIRELEWCRAIKPISPQQAYQWQPQPQPQGSPRRVQALLTANVAKISWQPPAALAHQTPRAWRHWQYELELMDVASNSAFNIRNIKSSFFVVEQLQANNLYRLRVRAAGRQGIPVTDAGGDWSEPVLVRSWPLGEHRLLWSTAEGFYETNELGEQRRMLLAADAAATARSFLQLNGTIMYVTNNTLHCVNFMNPELNCSFRVASSTAVGSIAYDWRGAKIYWTDEQRNVVLRASVDGWEPEMLPIFDAREIEIDSYAGQIYYSTGTRLSRRTLSGASESEMPTQELELFHVNSFGGTIRGFVLDLKRQLLYWVVRKQEDHVRLFRASIAHHSVHEFQDERLAGDIVPGSLEYVREIDSLMWLQVDAEHRERASHLVFARAENISHRALLDVPFGMATVKGVRLKVPYVPHLDFSVIPDAVDVRSIRIDEDNYWDDFTIRWDAIPTAENYTVLYRVLLQFSDEKSQLSRFYNLATKEPQLRITEFQSPQLKLRLSITPHTAWCAGSTVSAELLTPAAAPTQPNRLRVFIRSVPQALLSSPNISALIRWDAPENISTSTAVAYKIYCWLGSELIAERVHNTSRDQPLETGVAELLAGHTYKFQVQAFVAGRRTGGERTAFHAVNINPEVQAVPLLLYATSEVIGELDLDLDRRRVLVHTTSEVEHLALMQGEQRLLWVNENVELLTYVQGSATVKLARMRAEVLALTTDWVTRRVYWAELDNEAVSIYQLDLCRYEGRVMAGTKLHTTRGGRMIRGLIALPFSQMLVWLEHAAPEQNATLVGCNLTDGSVLELKRAEFQLMFEGSLSAEMETVNLVDLDGDACAYDVQRQLCTPLKLNFMTDELTAVERDNGFMYTLKNDTIRAYNRRKQHLEYQLQVEDVRKIRAFNYQEYPARECLLPNQNAELKMEAPLIDEDHFTLQLPSVKSDENCWLSVPGVRYVVTVLGNEKDVKLNVTRHEPTVNITQLRAFTNYTTQLKISTYYQQKLGLPLLQVPDLIVRTAVGTPSMPRNFSAQSISPTEIKVQWVEPAELNSGSVWYELHWQVGEIKTEAAHKTLEQNDERLLVLPNLLPSTLYTLWLQVFSTPEKSNVSRMATVQTFEKPRNLQLLVPGAYNLTLGWMPPTDVSTALLEWRALSSLGSPSFLDDNDFSIDITNKSSLIVITDLTPRTRYEFHLELSYPEVERRYRWPKSAGHAFVFETLGDRPSSPGRPQVEHITNEIFKVSWEPARNNGALVLEYQLEALQSRTPISRRIRRDEGGPPPPPPPSPSPSSENETFGWLSQLPWAEEPQPLEDKWIVYCRTSSLSCIVRDLHTMRLIMFRVRARNEPFGWGPYSEDSERVSEPFVTSEKRNSLVIAIIAPAVIVSACVLVLIVFRSIQNRRLRAKKLLEKSRPSLWRNFSMIQQQQQLMDSRNRAFSVASHSALYTGGPLSDADIALLPHISWSQITLLNFLGSGAFGEVYEGLIKHEDEEEPEKVAIKSLRKGASEFAELLQEAQLMSNFKHENIVRLIGVCCDAESISIIMEHMEGGDLLSNLRESRPNSTRPTPELDLLDLISMCIDVATGCSYLENMHFVHRDLACRNCLVSSRDRRKRVVKIGDFGLARDIYKNDYYRKEGEGLLPVRWMAPESLVDGIFSTQTDVWAFGVLCWEILTLGQQPYAARNNLDVLQYVKEGGRLEQPDICPDKLFALMLQCWKAEAADRPSFRKCLNVLLAVKADLRCFTDDHDHARDDDLYATYANNHSIKLSTFAANRSPPSKLGEKVQEEQEVSTDSAARISEGKTSPTKVIFDDSACCREEESESLNDDVSQLIAFKGSRGRSGADGEELNYYTNEGVSRL